MTTHLYPDRPKSFRSKFQFKPTMYTHAWQRPTGGDPSSPGRYTSAANRLHLGSPDGLPAIRGRCAGSCAATDRGNDSSSAGSSRRGTGAADEAASRHESSASLRKKAEELKAQAAVVDERGDAALYGRDLGRKVGVALYRLSEGKSSSVVEIVRKWDKNGKNEVNKTEFRMGLRAPPPLGLSIDNDHKDIDALFESLDRDGSGSLEVTEVRLYLEKLLVRAFRQSRAFA